MADFSLSHIAMWLGILAGAGILYVSCDQCAPETTNGLT